ncbi:hypothetical protein Tco_0775968 [Tanacetum coccineum]
MSGSLCNKFKGGKDKVMLRPRNAAWFKEKVMLAKAQEAGKFLDEEQLAFLTDPGIPDSKVTQTTIPNTATFQTEDLDAYDSDCDDVSIAKEVLMANLSNYDSVIISEVPHHEPYHTDVDNQSMHTMRGFEQTPIVDFTDNETTSDSNIILYSQYLQETQQEVVQDTNLYAQQDSTDLSKIKELDNIVYKVGQSAQTVHMLTKPQVFYDDTHKQALGYQNPFYIKNAQRIKPTLYDGSIISSQHVSSLVIDDEETLILEELNRLSKDFRKHFVPQQELSDEQAFWLQTSHPNTDQSASSPVKIEAPRVTDKEDKVKQKMDESETINIELEHSVAKLLYENERLHKEIGHLKKIYKDRFDSIIKTRALSKEHNDSLTAQLNSKSMENADLKCQIQDKVFVITSLKNDFRKLKGKETIKNATQIPIATTSALGMFKIDLEPLDPRLLNNKEAHIDYLKLTQEQAGIL